MKNIKKYIPEIIFTILFLFTYLPYFFYCWIPQLLNDSYAYLLIAKDFYYGKLPLEGHRMDLPYGYAYIISTVFKLGGSLRTITLIQTIIFYFSFLFLVNTTKRINFNTGLISSIVLWLYCSNSQSLLWNSLIYNESFYISTLVIITVLLIRFYYQKNNTSIYLITYFILIALFLRSNAIYLFYIPLLLIILKRSSTKHVIISFVSILLISSIFNLFVKNYFLPGESMRILNKIKGKGEYYASNQFDIKIENNYKSIFKSNLNPVYNNPFKQSFKLFTHITNTNFGNHYYYRMYNQIDKFNFEKIKQSNINEYNILRYKTISDNENEFASFILTNIKLNDEQLKKMKRSTDIEIKPRNIWLLANHVIELSMILYRNFIVCILFYVILFFSIYKLIKVKFNIQNDYFLVLVVASVHVFSLILLSVSVVSNNALPRYAYVTEFIMYLVVILGLNQILKEYKK